jgi:hypothetical protein
MTRRVLARAFALLALLATAATAGAATGGSVSYDPTGAGVLLDETNFYTEAN